MHFAGKTKFEVLVQYSSMPDSVRQGRRDITARDDKNRALHRALSHGLKKDHSEDKFVWEQPHRTCDTMLDKPE